MQQQREESFAIHGPQLEVQETFTVTGPQRAALGRVESKLPAPARKRPVAALALAALALVSVFGIGGAKLRGRYARTLAVYTQTDEYGHGIQQDQASQADAAASLIRLGGRVLGEEADTVVWANAVLDAWNDSDKQDPAVQYGYNTALYSAVGDLYLAVGQAAGDEEKSQLEALYAEFTSRQSLIERAAANTYNPAAEAYNRTTAWFPANAIGALWGVRQAPLFAPGADLAVDVQIAASD